MNKVRGTIKGVYDPLVFRTLGGAESTLLSQNVMVGIIFLDEGYNENRFRDYFRLDLKVNYTLNSPKVTHEFGLDLVNVLGTDNILGLTYTPNSPTLTAERKQLGFLPIFYYKIDFKVAAGKRNTDP